MTHEPAAAPDDLFELAPSPLWLEDWSGVRALLDGWRAEGVTDLRAFLLADRARLRASTKGIRILHLNAKALALYEAADTQALVAELGAVFQGAMLENHLEELVQLWDGATSFTSRAVNHTLTGRRLDIQLKGRVLPGHEADWSRLLVATEDVTDLLETRHRLAESEAYAKGLFEHSPVSLWVEDFSSIRLLIEEVRENGVTDFRTFLSVHPEFVSRCMSEIRVLDVNRQTLQTFAAPDLETLLLRQGDVFRDGMHQPFLEQLVDLWNGKLSQSREVVNYSLSGEELHFLMQFSVLPGHEEDWALVQVALTDITARKKAEAYLEYLGKHDVLTKLFNRSFYADELNRIERRKTERFTVLVADLNGLKVLNDGLGHAAGDTLLRRAGEVFKEAVGKPWTAARIGGDEFAVLMPGAGPDEGRTLSSAIGELCEINNQFYPGEPLSLSMGIASVRPGERLEDTVKRADLRMYEAKRAYYQHQGVDRRSSMA
ncbi:MULTISPECIES: sensor domain-containing diguanylate cyclase [unclassified Aureimonas]|uniref:sensor domain-containing diguanylate cyclase n=1 Tax=unclassified Aureimonas TaxID=2615206 RepID=UPI0006F294CB|nr:MULTISPECIES: sensor domain-containing diguanylate cyclase [unclassified Aureimonas]KQT65931.1 histidine kinase [Aureimonas sp. Leaf427]KQT73290.1 histidine kinase [Aureimonas sp. Leaf460]